MNPRQGEPYSKERRDGIQGWDLEAQGDSDTLLVEVKGVAFKFNWRCVSELIILKATDVTHKKRCPRLTRQSSHLSV
jgi:hypothetical protein